MNFCSELQNLQLQFNLKIDNIENIYHEFLKMDIPLRWKKDAIETNQ